MNMYEYIDVSKYLHEHYYKIERFDLTMYRCNIYNKQV